MASLGTQVARGAAWMVLLRACDRAIGLVSTIVLARLLAPADFGIVALVNSLIALIALLGAFGLDVALVQNRSVERRHFDTVWTFNVLFGLAMAVVLAALARPTADFYGDPRLVPVILALVTAQLIQAFGNVGVVHFRRDLEFDREFRLQILGRVVTTFVVTLPLAFLLRDYRALVGGTLASSVLGVVLSYRMHPFRPSFSLGAWRELFAFSKWMLATNVIVFVYSRAVDLIVGRLTGTAALGVFSLGKEMSRMPSSELSAPIQRAVLPGYARLSSDLEALRAGYLKVVSILALAILPAATGLAVVAEPVIMLVLGAQWQETIPVVRILAVEGMLGVGLSTTHYVFVALGTPHRLAGVLAVHAAISLPLMLGAVPAYGVVGASWALFAATCATVPVAFGLLARTLQVHARDLWAAVWRPTVATLAMLGPVLALGSPSIEPAHVSGHAARLVLGIAVGATSYLAVIAASWQWAARPDGAERFVLERVRGLFRRGV